MCILYIYIRMYDPAIDDVQNIHNVHHIHSTHTAHKCTYIYIYNTLVGGFNPSEKKKKILVS